MKKTQNQAGYCSVQAVTIKTSSRGCRLHSRHLYSSACDVQWIHDGAGKGSSTCSGKHLLNQQSLAWATSENGTQRRGRQQNK
jgi:hypothetical protein